MAISRAIVRQAVPDAPLIAKWHTPSEAGWEHAQTFLEALLAGSIRLTAPEHSKMEVIRVLQLGVRYGRFSTDEGLELIAAFLALLIVYVANDLLFRDAFQLASTFKMAFYDALYVALARTLEIRLITADRRLFNLANQRGLNAVAWFEDLTPSN